MLHGRGADREAFDILVIAARKGDDFAHQILGHNIDDASAEWASITEDWRAARATDELAAIYCYHRGTWDLDLT